MGNALRIVHDVVLQSAEVAATDAASVSMLEGHRDCRPVKLYVNSALILCLIWLTNNAAHQSEIKTLLSFAHMHSVILKQSLQNERSTYRNDPSSCAHGPNIKHENLSFTQLLDLPLLLSSLQAFHDILYQHLERCQGVLMCLLAA